MCLMMLLIKLKTKMPHPSGKVSKKQANLYFKKNETYFKRHIFDDKLELEETFRAIYVQC